VQTVSIDEMICVQARNAAEAADILDMSNGGFEYIRHGTKA
jgi:hypothetical protein